VTVRPDQIAARGGLPTAAERTGPACSLRNCAAANEPGGASGEQSGEGSGELAFELGTGGALAEGGSGRTGLRGSETGASLAFATAKAARVPVAGLEQAATATASPSSTPETAFQDTEPMTSRIGLTVGASLASG
jgi:hypothetical protein